MAKIYYSGKLNMVFKPVLSLVEGKANPLTSVQTLKISAIENAIAGALSASPLIDAAYTAAAVATRFAKGMGWSQEVDPLVLDLGGDGLETTDITAAAVHFDINGDLFAERTGWLGGDQAVRLWVSQSRKAASMRVCHPVPLARNCSMTSRDRRMVMRSFVTSSLGRPRNFALSALGNASKGRAFFISSAVHSGLSLSICSELILSSFFICSDLSIIGFPKADNANAIGRWRKNQGVKPFPNQAQCLPAMLPIISAIVAAVKRRGKIELRNHVEIQSSLLNVTEVFCGIEANFHWYYCMHNKGACQEQLAVIAANDNEQTGAWREAAFRLDDGREMAA